MKATRMHHSWVHMFITHQPTLTVQLHNFDLFRTCRTSSFCTVAWQLARFQLKRRIARSLGDSGASCTYLLQCNVSVFLSMQYFGECLSCICKLNVNSDTSQFLHTVSCCPSASTALIWYMWGCILLDWMLTESLLCAEWTCSTVSWSWCACHLQPAS